ncbi:esterase-like activity of phytase family protein [Cyanobium sp. T1B-Tous]|nr:esterase-like activity of phytase family protein [Cyanobium sp. T1B-Tous]
MLPCPLSAGWDVVEQVRLPPAAGGGFSAGVYRSGPDELWLLSDSPSGSISRWRGLKDGGLSGLTLLPPLPLSSPTALDGEGLVMGDSALEPTLWIASEGRLDGPDAKGRPAALLRFDLKTGVLRQEVPLPLNWRVGAGHGLGSNAGPESLTAVKPGGPLLMAAERPLQQDPPDRVRLLQWQEPWHGNLAPRELQPLAIPPGSWGLTDLLGVRSTQQGQALLGIWRRFEPPGTWQARLVFYPWPAERSQANPLPPRQQWDLGQLGLPDDNWEVLLEGPPLSDGRPTLVLGSDDNFNPLQANHLARLAPRRTAACQQIHPASPHPP